MNSDSEAMWSISQKYILSLKNNKLKISKGENQRKSGEIQNKIICNKRFKINIVDNIKKLP